MLSLDHNSCLQQVGSVQWNLNVKLDQERIEEIIWAISLSLHAWKQPAKENVLFVKSDQIYHQIT